MVPMRSVPHRVVCLVGLDDGVFPRLGVVDGDDVLARDPMTGERDIRSEDRQLLLDAVCAATEKLVITYTGADEHTGQPRPPAVPLAELLDALDQTTPRHRCANASSSSIRCSRSTFATSPPASWCPASRSPSTRPRCAAAQAAAGERREHPKFFSGPLPASRRRRRRARRSARLLQGPGQGLLPRAGLHAAVGRRRRRRRHARRHRRARSSGRSATGCSATCCAA